MTTYPGYPNRTHYSPNFSRRELDCRCGCRTPAHVQVNLVKLANTILEPLRVLNGGTLDINCAYRCPKHNATLPGAAKASKHLTGEGADVRSRLNTPVQLFALGKTIPAVGGSKAYVGDGFCHVDGRPRVNGQITTWA